MKILLVGSGGREHALAWKLLQSPNIEKVICTLGNGGTATLPGCQNIPIPVVDFEGIVKVAQEYNVGLVVVGPELPLSLGIGDRLASVGIEVFGPTQAGAQIEASKSWAKDLMIEAGVGTSRGAKFTNPKAAQAYVTQEGVPIVVKADGLASGKGVTVATEVEEAQKAITSLFNQGFAKIVVEECLTGEEVSVLALTDGLTVRPLVAAQDHKRIGEGDTGPNTGGMGAIAPAPMATPAMMARIEREILQPIVAALGRRGIDYRGLLYAGLMITPAGDPKVLEFNCRFGDPETQAILPLLITPLDELLLACSQQRLADIPPIQWRSGTAVCVVTASGGYPGTYGTGKEITGIKQAEDTGAVVFHAGTKQLGQRLVTDGGRVLGVTAVEENFQQARADVYRAVELIQFEGMYYRKDIGYRTLNQL